MSEFWDKAGSLLGTIAPVLATAVGGPFAGVATRAIASALGLGGDSSQEVIAQALQSATPDQLVAVKKAEADFVLAMKNLDVDLATLAYGDTADARSREVALKDWTPRVLALSFMGGFFGLLGVMAFREVPVANAAALNIMVGGLSAGVGTIMGYYFGSSSGSAAKNAILDKVVTTSAARPLAERGKAL